MKIKMMAIVISFCLVFSVSIARAATLTSANGTFSDGQQVTITGSSFGTAPTSVSFLTGENGKAGSLLSETGWSYSAASAG